MSGLAVIVLVVVASVAWTIVVREGIREIRALLSDSPPRPSPG